MNLPGIEAALPRANAPTEGYRPDIDGLRTVAVLSVVAYHAGLPWVTGGYAGVDIFFVISGYLITSLLLAEQLEERFSLREFYIRRARRLFPALFVVLTVSALLAWWLLMPSEMEDFGETLATAAAFSSNFMFWSEAGYFEGPSEFKPLLHTWSLAIEEQYYLLFPLLLLACKSSGRYLLALGLVALLSLAVSQWYVSRAPAAAFFLLPHRLWELMVGSLLATIAVTRPAWLANQNRLTRELLGAAGLTAIVVALFGFTSATPFPGLNALLPTAGTAAVIAAGSRADKFPGSVNRLLGLRPFVAIGLISYSLYLWHWPALVFAKLYLVKPPVLAQTLTVVGLSFVLAWLSWRFVEQPFRKPGARGATAQRANHRVLPVSGACILLLVTAGVLLDQTEGAPDRLPEQVVAMADVANDKPPERKRCSGLPASKVTLSDLCRIGSTTGKPDFLVWGDSHAMTLVPRFHQLADELHRGGLNATYNGCAPLLGAWRPGDDPDQECRKFNAAVLTLIGATPSLRTVVLAGRWGIYSEGSRYKFESGEDLALVDDQTGNKATGLAGNPAVWERSIKRTVTALTELGLKVVILDSIPEIGWDTPNVLARATLLRRAVNIAPTQAEFAHRQRHVGPVLESIATRGSLKVLLVRPATLLCDTETCAVSRDNQPLYIDEDHLSSLGTRTLLPLLRKALAH